MSETHEIWVREVVRASDTEYASIPEAITLIVKWRTGSDVMAGPRTLLINRQSGVTAIEKPDLGAPYHRDAAQHLKEATIAGNLQMYEEFQDPSGFRYEPIHGDNARGEVGDTLFLTGFLPRTRRTICFRRAALKLRFGPVRGPTDNTKSDSLNLFEERTRAHALTGKRGELQRICLDIASKLSVKPQTVRRYIQANYNAQKPKVAK
jgi:hypothetical protein